MKIFFAMMAQFCSFCTKDIYLSKKKPQKCDTNFFRFLMLKFLFNCMFKEIGWAIGFLLNANNSFLRD